MQAQLMTWETVEALLRGSRLTLLYGPPGTGKTTAAVNAARTKGQRVWNVTLTDETPAAELRGHWVPGADGQWGWMHGPAMQAFIAGGMLILNELDHASGDCLDFLHALLDDPGVASITLPNGETVFPGEGFSVVATMNSDYRELHEDREAIADRFCPAVFIDTPHPDAVASLPKDLQAAASGSAGKDHDTDRPATLRRWKAYAELRDELTPEHAAVAIFGHRADEVMDALKLVSAR